MTTARPAHALTPQEEAIISRWEAGLGSKAIAEQTGYDMDIVRRVLGYLAVKPIDNWQRPAAQASDQLAARIREVHPQMVPA